MHNRRRPILRLASAGGVVLLAAGAAVRGSPSDTVPVHLDPLALSRTIDAEIAKAWKAAKIPEPKTADDSEFLRRITLDLNGTIPTLAETAAFFQNRDRDKRRKKIDELLERPAYAEHMARTWVTLLAGRTYRDQAFHRNVFQAWFEKAFAANLPYDEMVRELLAGVGNPEEAGAVNLMTRYSRNGGPAEIAGAVSRTLLGVQIQCAQCHNHPSEAWTQEDFWGFAAFFARVKPRPIRVEGAMADAPPKFELVEARTGEVYLPDSEPRRPVYPKFLSTAGPEPKPFLKRRDTLAGWMTSAENPTFARALVNRVWATLIGRGIVDPVDDLSAKHPPSHPELLDAAASAFAKSGFNLRYLFRAIGNSRVYQLASGPQPKHEEQEKLFRVARLRPMSPEQLFYSLARLGDAARDAKALRQLERQREQYLRMFVFLFGNDEMQESDEFRGTLQQVLFLMNDPNADRGIRAAGRAIAARKTTDEERIDTIFLTLLSRPAEAAEKRSFAAYLAGAANREEAYEDLFWAVINTTEFIYNH